MFLSIIILLVGFVILIKGADLLVDGSSGIARKYGVSELAIGLTVVAFGTSMPELVVSLISSTQGYSDIVYGNVIGSNLFNLLFILGVAGAIFPLTVQNQTVWKEIPFSLFVTVLMVVLANDVWVWGGEQNILSRYDALILVVLFVGFVLYILRSMKNNEFTLDAPSDEIPKPNWKLLTFIGLGLVGLVGGGKLVVDNSVIIARSFGLSEKLIGLTIIAAGTSLPELATSAVAAFKRNSDIAVGNIIGSNIFNVLLILGVSAFITPAPFTTELNLDIAILLGATMILFVAMFTGKMQKLDRWEAMLLFLAYLVYLVYLIYRN